MYRLQTDGWYLERFVFLMGGIMVLISITLALLHSLYWLILTAFVGLSLLVFALTGFCLSAIVFFKLGARPRLQRPQEK